LLAELRAVLGSQKVPVKASCDSAATKSIKLDDVLDPSGTAEKEVMECVHGKAAGDQ
jgi:hypothetical protein